MSLQDLPSQIFADAEVRVGRMLAIQAEIARLQEMADRFEGETRSILAKIGGPELVDALFNAVADRVAGHPLVTLDEVAPRAPTPAPVARPVAAPPGAAAAAAPVAAVEPAPVIPRLSPQIPRAVEAPASEQIVDLGDDRLDYFGVPIAKNHLGMAREIVQEARDAVKANDRTGLAKYARRFGRVAWKRHLYFAIWRIECTGFNEAEHFPGDATVPVGAETAAASREPANFPDPPFDGEQAAIVSYAQAVGTNAPAEEVPEEPAADDVGPAAVAEIEADTPEEQALTAQDDDTAAGEETQQELTDDDLPVEEADASFVEHPVEVADIGGDAPSADQRTEEAEVGIGNGTTVVPLDPPHVAMEVRTSSPGELRLGAPRLPPAAPPMGRPPHTGPRPAPAPVQAQLADDTTFGDPDGAPAFDLAQQPPLFDDALPDFLKTPAASPAVPPRAAPPGAPRRFAPGL
ncbi:conserved hypothetical protein [Hyphomicrobiales bacterium]|jgi:hypothetical protein|nr:conserved hypothetical protein [Hyphomicrobiales bacterium]CAH1702582.1 hypothetical protein BOSEA1005_30454 [Hyphomicrobiales bacterium]CAI0346785.1 conserved hypothetical protein [Hyphomicrobiales bacterium]